MTISNHVLIIEAAKKEVPRCQNERVQQAELIA